MTEFVWSCEDRIIFCSSWLRCIKFIVLKYLTKNQLFFQAVNKKKGKKKVLFFNKWGPTISTMQGSGWCIVQVEIESFLLSASEESSSVSGSFVFAHIEVFIFLVPYLYIFALVYCYPSTMKTIIAAEKKRNWMSSFFRGIYKSKNCF